MYMLRASRLALVSLKKSALATWLRPQAVPNRQTSAGVVRGILIIVLVSRIGVGCRHDVGSWVVPNLCSHIVKLLTIVLFMLRKDR
ncbi:hypothetical protein D3C80_1417460 [compost metagenome]